VKNNEQVKERWDIVEMMGFSQTYRSLGHIYDSLEEVTVEVRKLNKKALSQTSFFIRDLTSEYGTLDRLKRG
jgi:hypothetical protein